GAALGTLGGASAGAIHSKLKEVKAKKQLAKVMKEMTNDPSWGDLFKHADMNVPTEEEKKKESNVTDDEDLADISCEVCGYQGKPDYQGFCPKCGTLGGIKPKAIAPAQDEMLTPSHDLGGNIYDESAHAFEDII
ncbi:MAG TPA: hypothetical protein DDZ89_18340, partial [Clostridiales bacterium]|nr:hypothetical protein [Clostridiales bacterium]